MHVDASGRGFGRALPERVAMLVIAVAGLVVRWGFVDFQSGDFRAFVSRWYAFISANGHLAALRDDSFSNYDTPYLALLALLSYTPLAPIVAVKALSVASDLVLAGVGASMVRVVRSGWPWASTVTFGVLFWLPTVVMNGAVWAQCDSLYAAAALAAVLQLMKGRPGLASAWFGVSSSLKLQAVFLLPVLIGVLLVNRHRLRSLVWAPMSFLACLVPALLAGRSLVSLLMVYPAQILDPAGTGTTVRGAGTSVPGSGPVGVPGRIGAPGDAGGAGGFTLNDGQSFTHNAPTPYAWLPADASVGWKYAGLVVTAAVVLGFGVWLLRRRRPLDAGQILLVAATASLLVPMLLPEMHERYFYLAEVLCAVAAVLDGRFLLPALAIQLASVTTYLAYLLDQRFIPLQLAAAIAVPAAITAGVLLVRDLSLQSRQTGRSHA
jgi:Gpi18-like mannosyltransferase